MKSTAAILLAGTLSLMASSYIPVLQGWGPMFVLCTGVALLVAWLVAVEPPDTRRVVSYKKGA